MKVVLKHLRIASDLHLEGFSGRSPERLADDFLQRDERDAESILILAGDISSHGEQLFGFLAECCKRFPKVYFVAGNHEFYRHHYTHYSAELKGALLASGLDNLEFAIDDVGYEELEDTNVRFIFTPLWADGGPTLATQGQVGACLNDFLLISISNDDGSTRRFRVTDMMEIHRTQKAEVKRLLEIPFDGKTIVITHHLPSRQLVAARFWPRDASDGINGGFVGDCDDLISNFAPDIWIHGHTHDTIHTTLKDTEIICNPAGYRSEYATEFNSYMRTELRDDGSKRAIPVPKFVDL